MSAKLSVPPETATACVCVECEVGGGARGTCQQISLVPRPFPIGGVPSFQYQGETLLLARSASLNSSQLYSQVQVCTLSMLTAQIVECKELDA